MKSQCLLIILSLLISQSLSTVYTRSELEAIKNVFHPQLRKQIASQVKNFLNGYKGDLKSIENKLNLSKSNKRQKAKTSNEEFEQQINAWGKFISSFETQVQKLNVADKPSDIEISNYFDSIVAFQKYLDGKHKTFQSQLENVDSSLDLKNFINRVRTYQPQVEAEKKRERKIREDSILRNRDRKPAEIYRDIDQLIKKQTESLIKKQTQRNKYNHFSKKYKQSKDEEVHHTNKIYNTPAEAQKVETIEPIEIPTLEAPVEYIEPKEIPTLEAVVEYIPLQFPELKSGKKARVIIVQVVDSENCLEDKAVAKFIGHTD